MPAASGAQEVGERIDQLLGQIRSGVNARTREQVEEAWDRSPDGRVPLPLLRGTK